MKQSITYIIGIKKYTREIAATLGIVVAVFAVLVAAEGIFDRANLPAADAAGGYTLNVTVEPNEGGVVVNSGGGGQIACGEKYTQCTGTYTEGQKVFLSVSHETTKFISWTGCDTSETYNCTVTMSGNKTVKATFTSSLTPPPAPPTPPVTSEAPRAPSCPFTNSDTRTVIDFGNGGKTQSETSYLLSNNGAHRELVKNATLSAGVYTVDTVSWDGYATRGTVSQSYEQWIVEARSGTTVLGSAGPTTDIADNVIQNTKQNTFTDAITLDGTANAVAAVHAYPNDTSSPNSVVPICIAFTKKAAPPAPTCTLSANPSTITQGGNTTLTLASQNADSATINQGVGAVAVNGTKSVAPNQTTTYTATVTGANNQTATCQTTVTVNVPVPNPTCALTINPSTIDQGDGTTLTWTSTNTTGGTINQNIGAVGVSGSRAINPAQSTTYTGTFTGTNGQTITCSASVTVVVKPEPDVPACPFTPNDGTIITFTTGRTPITSAVYTSGIRYLDANATLSAGTYTVKTFSWDGYNGREGMVQNHEQWNVETYAGASLLDSAGPTTDIADSVRSASAIDTFVDGIVISQTATKVRAQHAFVNDTSSPNSVVPVCAAFKKKEVIPAPTCTLSANPSTITQGGNTTLTLASQNADSATINQGVGAVAVNGTKSVAPNQTTTYTATVTGANNQTATCSATVTVIPPELTVPVCPFTPSANLTVIDFNGGKVRTSADIIQSSAVVSERQIGPKSVSLTPGIYTVQTYSWDGYNGRTAVSQPHEQWNAVLKNAAGATVGTAGATTDLQDLVTEAAVSNTFTDAITLGENAVSVYATHAYPNNISEVNSVVPVCVAFQKKIQNPAKIHGCVYEDVNRSQSKDAGDVAIPNTLITLTGTTYFGTSITRTMNTGTDGCYLFDNLEPGTYRVAETQPAGFDDFYDQIGTKGGTTANDVFSNIVLASGDFSENNNFGEVKPTVIPPAPICTLVANPILITQGGFSTLTLTSQNATNANISPAVGTITGTNGSYTVSPTQTTTYTATVTGANNQTATCVATITVTTPSALACSMSISSPKVKLGEKITLTWSSQNATGATIDPQIGATSVSGSREITIFGDTTYTGTFTGANNQTTTCSARVEIEKGGGSCTNCGGGGGSSKKVTKPNVVLSSRSLEPLDNFVYLSSMPYTGFEAGPFTTALFWIVIFGLSTGVAYAITFLAPLSFLNKAFAKVKRATGVAGTIREQKIIKTGIADVAPHLFPAYTVAVQAPTTEKTQGGMEHIRMSAAAGSAQDDTSLVEESAHTHGILLSPEAERIIKAEMHRAGGNAEMVLDDIFGRATREYQKEDGWILLSKERINTLIEKNGQKETSAPVPALARAPSQGAIHARELADVIAQVSVGNTERTFEARVPAAPAPIQKQAEAPREVKTLQEGLASFAAYRTEKKDITPATFVEMVIAGRQAEVFEMLRTLSGEGKAEAFILDIVRALDDVYKNRIEGGRTPNSALVTATAAWSNRDFEEVIRTFVECVDYSYTSPLVGTKVALAKLFEKFGTK